MESGTLRFSWNLVFASFEMVLSFGIGCGKIIGLERKSHGGNIRACIETQGVSCRDSSRKHGNRPLIQQKQSRGSSNVERGECRKSAQKCKQRGIAEFAAIVSTVAEQTTARGTPVLQA
ncbi:hypothetical protein [Pseudoscardovia suis]|uniref:hypothetical protein n=1 Tax=Pseudoscardovia suis TaxID=987063 RepID=UPI001198229C|nr:hypothetical protein [Pseudoscardovia suis]